MPFKKVGKGKYKSPSGRKFNTAQVKLYYANNQSFPSKDGAKHMMPRKGRHMMSKRGRKR